MTPTSPPGDGRRAVQKGMRQADKKRRGAGLLGLTSAAVLAVYAVGYMHTQPAAAGTVQDGATSESAATATPPLLSRAGSSGVGTTARTTPATPTSPPVSTQGAAYKDGTYSGSGNSRHGGITVSVSVSGGKISTVAITTCGTRYPCAQIAGLREQVLARQSAKVDHVSGATDSSTAYRQAVAAALAKAV